MHRGNQVVIVAFNCSPHSQLKAFLKRSEKRSQFHQETGASISITKTVSQILNKIPQSDTNTALSHGSDKNQNYPLDIIILHVCLGLRATLI